MQYRPKPTNQESSMFLLNAGMDTVNDPLRLGKGKFLDGLNINLFDTGAQGRVGTTIMGAYGASRVNGYGVIRKESGDIIVRACGTQLQKYSAGSWVNVQAISDIATLIVSYNCSDLTTAALATGTALATSTSRTVVKSGGGMTLNAYAGKILRITSGTGALQEKLIASNDLTTIYVEGLFETAPDATSVFDIREISGHVIVTNGTDTVFKYDGTTVTTFPTMIKWHSLEQAHNRLFGSRRDSDLVYVSSLGTQYFPKDNYLPINPDGDSIVGLVKVLEEVVVHKKNSRTRITGDNEDNFSLINANSQIGAISQGSIASGNNFHFFLGYGGIYSINSLDSSSVDEGLPLSFDINDRILAHSAAELLASVGWVDDNKYFCSIGNEVFVYDILQSQIVRSKVWTRYKFPQNITAAMVHSGVVYLGTATKSLTVGGTTDDGTVINCEITTGRITQKNHNQPKIYNRDYVNFLPSDTVVTTSIGFDGGSLSQFSSASIATNGQIKIPINRRANDIRYKYSFPATSAPKFSTHEQFFTRLAKTI